MNEQTVRKIRLPADHSSPGLAREAIRTVVQEFSLQSIIDEALLLTTELTTNSVVHAGTEVDLEIIATWDTLTVTVLDFRPGPFVGGQSNPGTTARSGGELDERGRGLLLVDRLAASWGTVHFKGGKGVWFRMDRPGAVSSAPTPPVFDDPAAQTALAPEALSALGSSGGGTTLAEVTEELLQRLCGVVGASGAALSVDEGDGPHTIAAFGRVAATADLSVPLHLTKPWRGELLLFGSSTDAYARPLTALTADRLALLVENYRLRRSDSERRTWLTFLAEASELLAQSLDVELTLALIPRLVVPRLGHWCAVHATDDSGDLRLAAAAHADETQLPEVLDALAQAGPQLKEAMGTDAVVPLAAPVEGYVIALIARGQQLGTLTVGRGLDTWQRTEEAAVVEDVARRAALAIDNARIHAERRAIAQALQRSLLPPQLPKVDGVEFGAEYVPTGEGVDVGGDFYDVVPLSERRWLVVVGDVSGKGVQAATVTGLVRDVTRVLVRDGRPLAEVLERLNETLVERGAGRFCTLCLAAVMRRPDHILEITLHLAGHDQPVLVRADGATELIGQCGTALGLLDTISSPRVKTELAPGDTLIFYTDGVTERRRGVELFGLERLRREAGALAGFPADVVVARLRAATLSFSPEAPRDDIAIFALRNDAPA